MRLPQNLTLESICLSAVTEIIDPPPSALVEASKRTY